MYFPYGVSICVKVYTGVGPHIGYGLKKGKLLNTILDDSAFWQWGMKQSHVVKNEKRERRNKFCHSQSSFLMIYSRPLNFISSANSNFCAFKLITIACVVAARSLIR